MIYFTSDLHLGHAGVIALNHRPFTDVIDMNQTLIRNFNSCVTPKDTVYLLGDITHRIPLDEANALISKLQGKKILVRGNHDKEYAHHLFHRIIDYDMISPYEGVPIALMHSPILEWHHSHRGSYMLHGHIHSSGSYNESNQRQGIRRYDVGVDANNYYPVPLPEILRFFGDNYFSIRIGK